MAVAPGLVVEIEPDLIDRPVEVEPQRWPRRHVALDPGTRCRRTPNGDRLLTGVSLA
jgi:hypothetical protein